MGQSRATDFSLPLLHGHAGQHSHLQLRLPPFHSTHVPAPVVWVLTWSPHGHCLVLGEKQPKETVSSRRVCTLPVALCASHNSTWRKVRAW